MERSQLWISIHSYQAFFVAVLRQQSVVIRYAAQTQTVNPARRAATRLPELILQSTRCFAGATATGRAELTRSPGRERITRKQADGIPIERCGGAFWRWYLPSSAVG